MKKNILVGIFLTFSLMGFTQSDYVLSFDGIDDAVIIELDSNSFSGYQGNSYKSLMIDMEFEVYGNSMADTFPVHGYLFTIPSLRLGVSYGFGSIYIIGYENGLSGLASTSGIQDSTFYRLSMTIIKEFYRILVILWINLLKYLNPLKKWLI